MKILIIGWFGAGNMGDEAILLSEIHSMRDRIKDVKFHILSFDPLRTRRLTARIPQVVKIIGVGSKHRFLKTDFRSLWRSFIEVDMVIVGGGGIFQDIYNHYPIPFFTSMVLFAKLLNKRVVLHSVGIGPVRTWIGKRLCRTAAKLADIVTVRDFESRDLLLNLGVNKGIDVCADPVFLLQPARTEQVDGLFTSKNLKDGLNIGVCIQEILSWSDENKKVLAEILDHLIMNKGARVVFIPLGQYRDGWFRKISSDSVDVTSSKGLASMMTRKSIIIEDELNPQELLTVIGGMDLLISMRLHGVIMGISMNVPVIGLTYKEETKISNLMNRIDQNENLFEVDDFDRERILNRVEHILSKKEHFKQVQREKHSLLSQMAERGLERLLKAVEYDEVYVT